MINKDYLNLNDSEYNTFLQYIQTITTTKDTAKLNILYVCDANYLMTKMSRVRFWGSQN